MNSDLIVQVRLLIGDKLGVRQHMVNANVTVKIIAEDEAKMLSATQLHHKDMLVVVVVAVVYSHDVQKDGWKHQQ